MTGNAFFHWNVDPVLMQLGPVQIRWYSIFFAAALLVGYWILIRIYKSEGKDDDAADSLLIYVVIGTVVGARLGHCFFYSPQFYFSHPIEILKVWEGGLASHGAAIGILAALSLYTRGSGRPSYLWVLDHVAIPIALAGFFIRIGNFFNSEIVGIPTSVRWAIVFDRVDPVPRHAVQLYEALAYGLIFIVLMFVYKQREKNRRDGMLIGLFLILVFSARFLLEFVKTRQAAYGADSLLTVGQWLSIPFVLLGFVLAVRARKETVKST